MDLHQRYGLRRVVNACGKMTRLGGAIVHPPIVDVVAESLRHFFDLDQIQAAAGRAIAQASGAESGCVTACTSAGITLSVAACMTGNDLGNVLQLPDTDGMPSRILVQKGHSVNYGGPLEQHIRLAGAEVVEVGAVNQCRPELIRHQLAKGRVAAVVAVESHHTVRHGWVRLPELVRLAHEFHVPVIVDGAAQDLRLSELVATGADLVLVSAHKFLCSTTAGIVAGRRDLVDAVYLQNRGIGRGMKAGKEAIFGVLAALDYRGQEDISAWTREQDRRVQRILDQLADLPGLQLGVEPDPNGCPFSRVRLTPDPAITGHDAHSLTAALADGDPMIVTRSHHADEGYLFLDAVEMTDEEIDLVCRRVRQLLAPGGVPS